MENRVHFGVLRQLQSVGYNRLTTKHMPKGSQPLWLVASNLKDLKLSVSDPTLYQSIIGALRLLRSLVHKSVSWGTNFVNLYTSREHYKSSPRNTLAPERRSQPRAPAAAFPCSTACFCNCLLRCWLGLRHMLHLLNKLKIPLQTPIIFCDNPSTASLSHTLEAHARTKRVEFNFFVWEKVLSKNLLVYHIPSADQSADILTKRLFSRWFICFSWQT